jgi:hypothetical protein
VASLVTPSMSIAEVTPPVIFTFVRRHEDALPSRLVVPEGTPTGR